MISYKAPTVDEYVFDFWAQLAGWFLAWIPAALIPLAALAQYINNRQGVRMRREGNVAQWLERLTASPVMYASLVRTPLFPFGIFREIALFPPSQCD